MLEVLLRLLEKEKRKKKKENEYSALHINRKIVPQKPQVARIYDYD